MALKVAKKENIVGLLERLARDFLLIAPVREDNLLFYRPVDTVSSIDLNPGKSVESPKGYFFPQTETLYRYRNKDGTLTLTEASDSRPAVLFGVHPCDLRSFAVLDAVLLDEPADKYYAMRREETILIGMSCSTVFPECFCTTYGISPVDGKGADIHLTDAGANYLVEILTPKGEELITKYEMFFEENLAGTAEAKKGKEEAFRVKFKLAVQVDGLPEKMPAFFDNPLWEKLSRRCLGCGICTYVCPTCHCFDIMDEGIECEGERLRCWDSCIFREYTLHTSGHNPRHALMQRLRNRFFHKLSYNHTRYNIEGCVGCGRCVASCPTNIDIREVIGTLRGLGG
ncbi:MAG: 4Fe-4S dicluster domain-containing protein [Bacillota bacterium]